MRVPRVLFLSILLLALTALSFAQATATGSFVGRVTDPTGKEIAGAKVTATNMATHFSRTVETTSAGYYALPGLLPGTYDVSVEASGFGATKTQAPLNVGDSQVVDFNLHPGSSGSADPPLLQPTRTDMSSVVNGLDLRLLPVFASSGGGINDFTQLALITPGMKLDTSGNAPFFASGQATGVSQVELIGPGSINFRYNQYNITGLNITDQVTGGRNGVGASVEEVQEFQVLAANYDAQYGQAGGFLLNAVTKSGSNTFHGDGHVYFRGRNLAASNPFYNLALAAAGTPIEGARRAPFHRQEGGLAVGGPMIKDRLFWFANFEISHQGAPVILTPPSGNVILEQPTGNQLYSGRLDYKLSDRHTLFLRVAYEHYSQDNQIVSTGSNVTQDGLTDFSQTEIGFNAGLTSTLSPFLVNQAGFSFFHMSNDLSPKSTLPAQFHPTFFSGANFLTPESALQKRFQFLDNLTWVHGRHTVKAGFDVSVYPWTNHNQEFAFGQYLVNALNVPIAFTFAAGPGVVEAQDTLVGLFLQDSWRITPKLTLNYGLRYDVEAGAFDGGTQSGGGGCRQANGLIPACSSDHNNFQPRVGIAYAPWPHTVFRASFTETTQVAINSLVLNSRLFDGVNQRTITTANPAVLAAFPNFPSAAVLAPVVPPVGPPFGRVRPISSHLRNPEVRSVNLAIEHQFGRNFVLTAQYLGQFGQGLFGERDLNAPVVAADPAHPGFFYYKARPDPSFTAVRTVENTRTSSYNGLLLTLNKRFSSHAQFFGNFTWAHSITSADDFFGLSEPGDPTNIRAERGPAFDDIRLATNFGIILDSGRATSNRVAGWFLNDVTLGFLGQVQSPRPYNLSTGSTGFLNARFFGLGNDTQQRPNVLPDGTLSSFGVPSADGANANFGPGGVASCIGAGFPAALCNSLQNTFIAPADASPLGPIDALTGDIVDFQKPNGSLGRNAARGAPFYRLDASLQKSFRLPTTQDVRLEFRVDAFNLFNHSNFQGFNFNNDLAVLGLALAPGGTPAANFFTCNNCLRPNGTYVGSNGQPLSLLALQHGQVSPNLLNPVFGGVGDPSSADIARTLQLSVRVRFGAGEGGMGGGSHAGLPSGSAAGAGASAEATQWKGIYFGGYAGVGIGRSAMNTSTVFSPTGYFATTSVPAIAAAGAQRVTLNGFNGGVQGGYNFQRGRVVFGLEADLGGLNREGTPFSPAVTYPCCAPTAFRVTQTLKTGWLATVRPRAGFTSGKTLFYGTAGVAVHSFHYKSVFSDTFATAAESATADANKTGWIAGGGVEYKLHPHWSLKGEYLYADFGQVKVTSTNLTAFSPPIAFPTNVFTHNADLISHIVRGGVNWHF